MQTSHAASSLLHQLPAPGMSELGTCKGENKQNRGLLLVMCSMLVNPRCYSMSTTSSLFLHNCFGKPSPYGLLLSGSPRKLQVNLSPLLEEKGRQELPFAGFSLLYQQQEGRHLPLLPRHHCVSCSALCSPRLPAPGNQSPCAASPPYPLPQQAPQLKLKKYF